MNYKVLYTKRGHHRVCYIVDVAQETIINLARGKGWTDSMIEEIDYDPAGVLTLAFKGFLAGLRPGDEFVIKQFVGINYCGSDNWILVPDKYRLVDHDNSKQNKYRMLADGRLYHPRMDRIATPEKMFKLSHDHRGN